MAFEGASPYEQLVYAAKHENSELAAKVLSELGGTKDTQMVNMLDSRGLAPLHHAVLSKSDDVFEKLLQYEHTDIDVATDTRNRLLSNVETRSTALHLACAIENVGKCGWYVQELVDAGAQTEATDGRQRRPADILEERKRGESAETQEALDEILELVNTETAQHTLAAGLQLDEEDEESSGGESE